MYLSHFFCMKGNLSGPVSRLGILGGTFDPIHNGHLAIAEEALRRYSLDAVLFIPAGEPPHKPLWQASAEQRYAMVQLAISGCPNFYVSRMEIERPGPSYTVDTLRALHEQYPDAELFFIIGADSATDFHNWRQPKEILKLAHIVAASRPNFVLEQLAGIRQMPMTGVDISSTEIRARVGEGKSISGLVPEAVADYADKAGLYRQI